MQKSQKPAVWPLWQSTEELVGQVVYTGKTSMEINVRVYVERPESKTLTNTAYFVMVAIDENERPSEVPELIIDHFDVESLKENELAKERSRQRKARRLQEGNLRRNETL